MAKNMSNSIPADDGAADRTPNSGCNVILFCGGEFSCLLFLPCPSAVCYFSCFSVMPGKRGESTFFYRI